MKKWVVSEVVGPIARRIGGQVGALAVGAGLAQEHESAVAAIVVWAVLAVAELLMSARNRKTVIDKALEPFRHTVKRPS